MKFNNITITSDDTIAVETSYDGNSEGIIIPLPGGFRFLIVGRHVDMPFWALQIPSENDLSTKWKSYIKGFLYESVTYSNGHFKIKIDDYTVKIYNINNTESIEDNINSINTKEEGKIEEIPVP